MPDVAEHELREEREVEADEHDDGRGLGAGFREHPAGHLRPPEVESAHVSHDGAADHDVVEVRDDEVGVREVDVHPHGRQEKPGETADREESHEPDDPVGRRFPRHRALVHRRRPVEGLHRGGNGHEHRDDRKDESRVDRLAAHEEVVAPDEEAEDRDRQAREGDEAVSEHLLAGDGRDELAHDAHRRQDHDVDRRMGVEPEQVLEQHGVAAEPRVEEAETKRTFSRHERDRDRDDRRAENHYEARRVDGPHEERQAEPREARAPACGARSR